eukprot:14413768-Alexandrium_andersonii.AAC.1
MKQFLTSARGASQLRSTPMTLVCTPAARALARSLSASTLWKAPDMSEQCNAMRRPEAMADSQ